MTDPATKRLIIVEDHELLATSLALALRAEGLEVATVGGPSVAAVIETVRNLAPALVLLDLDLGPPLGSGVNLIGPLIDAGGRVVIMTGVDERPRLGACVEAGAVGIISKTEGFAGMVAAVRRALDGEVLLTDQQRHTLLSDLSALRRADRERAAPFEALSPREQAVLVRLAAGDSAETIANQFYVSLATVRTQIRSILQKLGVRSQLAAVALAHNSSWPEGNAGVHQF